MKNVEKIFREVGDSLVVDSARVEVHIPQSYFSDEISEWFGDKLKTICIFKFRSFADGESKGTDHIMLMPVEAVISYSDRSETESETGDDGDGQTEKIQVLHLERGDVFIENLNITKSADAVKRFVNLLHGGHLPRSIPYEKVMQFYFDCLDINGVDLEVPSVILEAIVSELYRGGDEQSLPFRRSKGKTYRPVNIKRLAALNSSWAAVAFEDMGQALVSSVARGRRGVKDVKSPIEDTIRY